MFQFAYSYFYVVICMLYPPYMDVYFNLPISKIINIYIYTNKTLIFYMYMWIIFEIGRLE